MGTTKQVRLSEIAELITKGTTPTTLGFDFQDEGINFLKIECFSENGSFMKDKVAHISEECYEKLKRSQLEVGDILFSIAGAIGRVAMVTEEMLPANTNQALSIIRIKRKDIYLPYIKLVLTSPFIKTQFERKKQGVAQLNISLKDISELTIPFPEIDKQREYVTIFDCVLRITSACQQRLQKLDELVKSRFVEMFGDPIINEKKWATKKLDKACIAIVDCPHSTPNYTSENTGYMCIRTSIVKKNRIMWEKIEYIKEDEYYTRIRRKRPGKGDIIYTREGAILGIAAVIDRECNVALGQRSMLLSPDKKQCTSEFLSVAMNCDSFLSNALKGQSGSASPHINVGDIKDFQMIMPPISQQRQFSAFVAEVDKSKLAVKQSLEKLETLKKSLMQQYFE